MNQPSSYNPLAYDALSESISRELLGSEPIPLGEVTSFSGSGIYALFYYGEFPAYGRMVAQNRDMPGSWPVYVGKAAPSARKGGEGDIDAASDPSAVFVGTRLFDRMKNHRQSILAAENLEIADFSVKLLVLSYIWVPMAETAMITRYMPLWNKVVDGFGNHDPGSGRINGVRSRWDTLHPGRAWSGKYPERRESAQDIEQNVIQFLMETID